ncbi:MAG: hypothetical protein ACP5GT_04605 [Conexivisphaera sp.]
MVADPLDEEVERILARMARSAPPVELATIDSSARPGLYEYDPARRAWRRARPAGRDGLLVVLRERAGSCRSCPDFVELAVGASVGGLRFAIELLEPDESVDVPRLSLSCYSAGEVAFARSYRGFLGLPELSSLVARFARACPSIDSPRVLTSIRSICPCSEH